MDAYFMPVSEMSAKEKKAARNLTLKEGDMRNVLSNCISVNNSCVGNVGMVYDGDLLVAWALAFKYQPSQDRTVYMYVREDYRRQGIGTWLFKEMKIRYKNFNVSPWDKRSASFYLAQNIQDYDRKYATMIVGAK